jgi:hypothetical protein
MQPMLEHVISLPQLSNQFFLDDTLLLDLFLLFAESSLALLILVDDVLRQSLELFELAFQALVLFLVGVHPLLAFKLVLKLDHLGLKLGVLLRDSVQLQLALVQLKLVPLGLPQQNRVLLSERVYLAFQALVVSKPFTLTLDLLALGFEHPPLEFGYLMVLQHDFSRIRSQPR